LRQEGAAQFGRSGLPSRKIEAWHYTDLAQHDVLDFPMAAPAAAGSAADNVLTLRNGFLVAAGRLPEGVTLERLESSAAGQAVVGTLLPAAQLPLVALNAGRFGDGLVLRVAAGTQVAAPIELVSELAAGSGPLQMHSRLLLLIETGASLTLTETHRGQGQSFSTAVTEIVLAADARLYHVTLQDHDKAAVHVATQGLELAARAHYQGVVLQLGGRLARHELHAVLAGGGAQFSLDGATLARGRQHLDNTTRVVHRAAACRSRQLFKTVLDEEGHGIFQGTVLVERGAQKTLAHQLSRALMLSDRAAMDNKPELEIFADDVKCGHGATIGDIDDQQLFYLRARGIQEAEARQMLTLAFLSEVLDSIADAPRRAGLEALLQQRLGAGAGA
jgi:Fe-S cluster assembly protein SufD